MGTAINFLDVYARGNLGKELSSTSGIDVSQACDGAPINGVDFVLDYDASKLEYDSTKDKVYLVSEDDGWGEELSAVGGGQFFRWAISPFDLNMHVNAPSKTVVAKNAHIAIRRNTSGTSYVAAKSKNFIINVTRERTFSPFVYSGLLAWYNAYDLVSSPGYGTNNVGTWSDKSLGGYDVTEGTNKPSLIKLPNDCPGVFFDVAGTNQKLTSSLATLVHPLTVHAVVRYRTSTGTFSPFVTIGGTNCLRIGVDNTNVIAKVAAGSTTKAKSSDSSAAADMKTFVVTVTYNATDLTVKVNNNTAATSAVATALDAGAILFGANGTDGEPSVDVMSLIAYNSVITDAATLANIIGSLGAEFGVSV